jgi:hypothetical protein
MEPLDEIPSANATFPYEDKLAAARRYLASRGITDPKPVYHTATARHPAPLGAVQRAHARWFPPAASSSTAETPSRTARTAAPNATVPVQRTAADPVPSARAG